MPELLTGLGIFKSLYDSAKALKDINDAAVRNGAIVELQEKILAAQEAQFTLTQRVSDLEKQLAEFETWDANKKEYEMKALSSGTIIYELKPDGQATKPAHYICTRCYEHRKRSILQIASTSMVSISLNIPSKYRCLECKSEFVA